MSDTYSTIASNPIVDGAMGYLIGAGNDLRQVRQQRRLNELQMVYHKQMTEYNMQKALEMWNATGYGAQVKQMQEAGLNPAYLYGKGGTGGTASIQPGNVNAGTAPVGGNEQFQAMGIGLDYGMKQAQINLLNAQAKNTEADTAKKVGVDTEEAKTRIADLTQGIENKKAAEILTKAETYLKNIEGYVQGSTMEEQIDLIKWNTKQATLQVMLAENEAYISSSTIQEKVNIIKAEAITAVLRNSIMRAEKKNIEKDTQKKEAEIKNINADAQLKKTQTAAIPIELKQKWEKVKNEISGIILGYSELDSLNRQRRIENILKASGLEIEIDKLDWKKIDDAVNWITELVPTKGVLRTK